VHVSEGACVGGCMYQRVHVLEGACVRGCMSGRKDNSTYVDLH
jgi:hypothetical protein